jgi:hypothetical protein
MLQTPFDKPIYGTTSDLSGDLATGRGSDPNSEDGDKPAGLINFWEDSKQPLPEGPKGSSGPSSEESANSVSGLPKLPNRFAPSETPPDPPSLERRNPGTIDKK